MNLYAVMLVIAVGAGVLYVHWYFRLYENWIVSMLIGFTIGLCVIMAVPDTRAFLPGWMRLVYCVLVGLLYKLAPARLLGQPPERTIKETPFNQDMLDAFFEGDD